MEMKVGALIVASVVLLVGFVVVMGGLSLQPSYRVFVDFENPGGLQSGAPVRISGAYELKGDGRIVRLPPGAPRPGSRRPR